MFAYRLSILGVLAFALLYPAISGSVLILGKRYSIDEIYPLAPWALFCFVPNEELDYAIQILSINGRTLHQPASIEELHEFSEDQKTIAYSIVQDMGELASADQTQEFHRKRKLFEKSFLRPIGQHIEYELVTRQFDVLERWQTGKFDHVEIGDSFVYESGTEPR